MIVAAHRRSVRSRGERDSSRAAGVRDSAVPLGGRAQRRQASRLPSRLLDLITDGVPRQSVARGDISHHRPFSLRDWPPVSELSHPS